ncbi:ArsB/NhaD family transporter [Streptomyces sp. SL13]|uniref:ArsB/NhaD family transporter n=1 Tax=Streptantibioticus silvisoli TaxID=2705255 RepID=A0AA90H931_9ACTN|nr:SLC13 family permease [Streptantibioticus silvisoli]MDI5964123.1 ArsB/NhaD family transporter [Streptantibioticus silvisoli]MDI5974151.1 ArsB/NhaD family transporter [Streptantibioticus silvisoli]
MDWIAVGLLICGVSAVASGLLPASDARATVSRILPLLIFLGSVIVLAELAAKAELFDVVAILVTALGRGRNVALFLLAVCFAALTTMFLNLDTTAVLLTPVLIATARRASVPVLPLAMTAVWLANTASLLLPVSNLTNLLAANRIGLQPTAFAARMALPQLAVLIAVGACLWVFYWRRNPATYEVPPRHEPHDRRLFWTAAVCVLGFVGCIVIGISIAVASVTTAAVLAVAVAVRDRRQLTWSLLPWRLLVFVTGLFLVVDTADRHGLSHLMARLIGGDGGASGVVRAAAVGAASSNALNNLPSYVAGEAVIPVGNHEQLIGLLIGTNVGPLVVPWASLATMLWAERCRIAGVSFGWGRFLATSALTALAALSASVGALLVHG